MLIPFPSPPAIRKLPDNVFEQIAAAIDPPEVAIDVRPQVFLGGGFGAGGGFGGGGGAFGGSLGFVPQNQVRVIREEAIGLYEVAVLAASSANALKRWMADHKCAFPSGMDVVCPEYIQQRWCFVAVKTKVKQKDAGRPRPGQRKIEDNLPEGASFDGHVQAMGFRFRTRQLVVPMRLSVHNSSDLHNVVYLLSDTPSKIRHIPQKFVRRQVSGMKLYDQMTQALPLRIIGGTIDDVSAFRRRGLVAERDPQPHNGVAAELFASDIVAARSRRLESRGEAFEKDLLKINEALDLRGKEVDKDVRQLLFTERRRLVRAALKAIEDMTLTVIDGDFPREVLARENLTFAEYHMPLDRSDRAFYDANKLGQFVQRPGTLYTGDLERPKEELEVVAANLPVESTSPGHLKSRVRSNAPVHRSGTMWLFGLVGLVAAGGIATRRFPERTVSVFLSGGVLMVTLALLVAAVSDAEETPSLRVLVKRLGIPSVAEQTADQIVTLGEEAVPAMIKQSYSRDVLNRGWAIVCLGRIGGDQAMSQLRRVHSSRISSSLLKLWSAAAMIKAARSDDELDELSQLVINHPALIQPFAAAFRERLRQKEVGASIEALLKIGSRSPLLRQSIADELSTESAHPILLAFLRSQEKDALLALASQYPGVGSPFAAEYCRRIEEKEGLDTVESQLVAASRSSVIAQSVGRAVLSAGSQPLIRAMLQSKKQDVRRQAAGYLASLAQSPDQAEVVVADIVKDLKFDRSSKEPPWHGGPLFVPGIQWKSNDARKLVDNLIRWHLWADENELAAVQQQVNNNLRSLMLARVAGYQVPSSSESIEWLKSWKRVVGREELERLLSEQHLEEKYSELLDN